MFPWAKTDLEGYWSQTPRPPAGDHAAQSWLIEQCQGIAEALKTVHSYRTMANSTMLPEPERQQKALLGMESSPGNITLLGRHGDIKPENILWFPDDSSIGGRGILKITDFGIARFTAENKAQKRAEGHVPNSVTYRSPECDFADEEVSAQCDVWALGCVYLVFVVWLFGGYEAVEKFAARRTTYDRDWVYPMHTDSFFAIEKTETGDRKAVVKSAVSTVSLLSARKFTRC
jgi:serine/threonine protein kinase